MPTPDPLVTIGTIAPSTAIRVGIGSPLSHIAPVRVILSADYARLGNYPAPVGTPKGALASGTTAAFYKPEADAIVAAAGGAYA